MSGHNLAPDANNSSKKSDNSFLLMVILAVVVFVGLGAFVWYRFLRDDPKTIQNATLTVAKVDTAKLSQPEKSAMDSVQKFLENIKNQNNTAAFNLFSDALKAQYPGGVNDFSTAVTNANLPGIKDWTISGVSTNGSKDRITIKGEAIFAGPSNTTKASFEFSFYKTPDGDFRMYSWQVTPAT